MLHKKCNWIEGNIGIKVSTGEKGFRGYLKKELINPLVKVLIN